MLLRDIAMPTTHTSTINPMLMGNELGHYIHSSIPTESSQVVTPVAANFGSHLHDRFPIVWLHFSAYGRGTISKAVPRDDASPATKWIDEIKQAHELNGPRIGGNSAFPHKSLPSTARTRTIPGSRPSRP
jgi:hypothetical protein